MERASLFLETGYSFNGSNITIDTLINKAKAFGYKTLVLTDRNMHMAYQFYHKTTSEGIQPILGLQLHLEPLLNGSFIHATAYAQNEKGYKNLLKLASLASFHDTVPLAMAKKYSDGLSFILNVHLGEMVEARQNEHSYKGIVHELNASLPHLYIAKHEAFALPKQTIVKPIPMDYVWYLEEADTMVHESLKAMFNKPIDASIYSVDGSVKSLEYFKTLTNEDKQQLDEFLSTHHVDLGNHQPRLPAYKSTQGLTSQAFLEALSKKGLDKRLKQHKKDAYTHRLEEELKTIHELGYDDYFLIVWDVIKYAKKEGILVGPGRGSAPGSLVAYSLGITDVDPLAFDLLFERFLNKARSSMPDIDIDFPDHAREKVIEYTKKTYGQEYVSYICTFGTFLKKSALRESARQFDVDAKMVNQIARYLERFDSVEAMIQEDKDVQNRMEQHENVEKWLEVARRIEGLPKHVGTHAAGIIISSEPIVEYTAIQEGLQSSYQTQYAMEDLERIGLLKMDFLGLRNLTMIETIVNDIEKDEGKRLNMYKLPLHDEKTFALLREGSTSGIFQLESRGMRRLIKDMQIKRFEDIVAILALFRPGPMESIPTYLNRRHNKEEVTYVTDKLKPILEPTEGILLYQEQIMAIASAFAGYSMNEADLLRRAVSKKDEQLLLNERKRFVQKAKDAGESETLANEIYDYIVKFANYGFNKSHSVAYALISYWMAYLKANYPAYFVGVLMQSAMSNEALMREYIHEAQSLGLEVKNPHVYLSKGRFTLHNKTLYYPMTGIKNIGKSVLDAIHQAAKEKPFESYTDFVARTYKGINKRNYQYLIYAGACDYFNLTKQTMLDNLEAIMHFVDYQGDHHLDEFMYDEKPEFEEEVLKRYEKEALGFNLKHDALYPYRQLIKKHHLKTPHDLLTAKIDERLRVLAEVSSMREITTKKGQNMAFLTLEDKLGSIDAVCFPRVYEQASHDLNNYAVLYFEGHVNLKGNQRQFVVESARKLKD